MLINLLDNAVDACAEDGQVRVHTCASNGSENRREGVTIELADTGAGIAPEILPKVFDLFMTTKPSGKGTGLGLVICQEIIKSHGGSIGIASELGRGTTVTVFLPSAGSPPAKAEERHESPHIDR
jgi:signal transduction histidine kinase